MLQRILGLLPLGDVNRMAGYIRWAPFFITANTSIHPQSFLTCLRDDAHRAAISLIYADAAKIGRKEGLDRWGEEFFEGAAHTFARQIAKGSGGSRIHRQ